MLLDWMSDVKAFKTAKNNKVDFLHVPAIKFIG